MDKIFSVFAHAFQSSSSDVSRKQTADITFSVNNSADYVVLPVVPADLPELSAPQNNEVFNAITGDIAVIGTMGLRELTIASFLPSDGKNYPFARPTGSGAQKVIDFFNKWRNKYVPIRCAITYGNGDVYIDIHCLVDDFVYHADKVNDVHYSLHMREYKTSVELDAMLRLAVNVRNE